MSIGYAKQKGTLVYIYDNSNKQITSVSVPGRYADDGLKGYDQKAVYVKQGNLLHVYDEVGHRMASHCLKNAQNLPPAVSRYSQFYAFL